MMQGSTVLMSETINSIDSKALPLMDKTLAGKTLAGKTVLVSGASRGIGLAIALRAASDGANVVILAKTVSPHRKLFGTIYTAAEEVEKVGGRALAVPCDIRHEDQVQAAVAAAVERFGGIDIVVNNASAIYLSCAEETDLKRFDLMHQVNARGTFLVSKLCLPHLKKSTNPHILMLSPPLDLQPEWFGGSVAYSMAKFGMSLCALGLAEELRPFGVAVNALWPRTTIATAAIFNILGGERLMRSSRRPEIVADAAHAVFCKRAAGFTGNFLIDDTFLAAEGVTNFDQYRVDPGFDLTLDLFVPENAPAPDSLKAKVVSTS
jgi:citronellol/citronellal dehydrogenase